MIYKNSDDTNVLELINKCYLHSWYISHPDMNDVYRNLKHPNIDTNWDEGSNHHKDFSYLPPRLKPLVKSITMILIFIIVEMDISQMKIHTTVTKEVIQDHCLITWPHVTTPPPQQNQRAYSLTQSSATISKKDTVLQHHVITSKGTRSNML